MQQTLHRFWSLRLLGFPNELLIKIIEYLPKDGIDLKNLRLTCRLLHDFSTAHMFHDIAVPRNLDDFSRAVEKLSRPHIGKNIHEVKIRCEAVVQRANLRRIKDADHNAMLFEIPTSRIESMLPRWTSTFAVNVFQLFGACKGSLRKLSLHGLRPQESINLALRTEEAFVGGVVEALARLEFAGLQELTLNFRNVGTLAPLWDRYTSGTGATLETNLCSVRTLSLKNPTCGSTSSKDRVKDFLELAMNLNLLTSFEMALCRECATISTVVAPLAMNTAITSLELCRVRVLDNFPRVLKRMENLRKVTLYWFALEPEQDRWEAVFGVFLANEGLEVMDFDDIFYSATNHCDGCFCSPYQADMHAYNKVYARIEELIDSEKMEGECPYPDPCYGHGSWNK